MVGHVGLLHLTMYAYVLLDTVEPTVKKVPTTMQLCIENVEH